MKALKFNFVLLLSLLISNIHVKSEEVVKELHKEYDANKNTHLIIKNKYGKVDIKNWEKNLIQIDVKIKAEHIIRAKAERILECITVDFSQEGDVVKAVTEFNNKLESFSGKKNFTIDYSVFMPKHLQLTLSNRYGNTFINELTGLANIEIKYGDLNANKIIRGNIKPLSFISIGYGSGEIEEVDWLKTRISYAYIEIEKSQALIFESKYSKIYVTQGGSIVSESKYDTYRLGTLNNFISEGAYTSYKMDRINKKLKLEVRYGGCKVNYIPENFKNINIDSRYTGISLGIDPDASYHLKGDVAYGSIQYPRSNKVSSIRRNTSHSVTGLIGEGGTESKVIIDSEYGSVNLNY